MEGLVTMSDKEPRRGARAHALHEESCASTMAAVLSRRTRADRTHKGTGIGLALVRGLVERMRGQVTGRNTNPGFEVRVLLPLRAE
jgi:hypothetical protein